MENNKYDDFYVIYFDSEGKVIYPNDMEEISIITELLKNGHDGMTYCEDESKSYAIRSKKKIIDGKEVEIVELSNVKYYINQIEKANVDETTQLNNRRIAKKQFVAYIEKAYNDGEDFTILMNDIDGFKKINDTYGHFNGDVLLSEVSKILYKNTRQNKNREQDIVARFGGDEFFILLKNITEETSVIRAEKIRNEIQNHSIYVYNEKGEKILAHSGTMSMGLYHVTSEELADYYSKGYSTEEIRRVLLERCDSALYESKEHGKNKVTIYNKERKLCFKM